MQTVLLPSIGVGMQLRRMDDASEISRNTGGAADAVLVTRAQSGNQAAWTELDRRWRHRMARLVAKQIGPLDEVQDVVQNAFVAAYQSLHRFRQDAQFGSWLHKITSNKCRDWLRQQKRKLQTIGLADEKVPSVDSRGENELKEAIRKAVASLPVGERLSVNLALWGYTRRQIAERLGWPIGTVSTRIRRAHKKLREQLVSFR